ncbi:MAG: hypothetical protein GSR86_01390 [Desulfurococcales archaeon]|nr:hypothetical protein [Desulfurococcales archaeon]
MAKSPIAKLADAVNWLESELKRLEEETRGKANELVRLGDLLSRELVNDIDIMVHQVLEDALKRVNAEEEKMEIEYKARIESEVALLEEKARANFDKAVAAVTAEVKKMLGGA